MTLPNDRHEGSPRERFRNILSAEQDEGPAPEPRKPAVVNLPKPGERGTQSTRDAAPAHAAGEPNPGIAPTARLLRTFWTVGGLLSVLANAILASLLIGGRGLAASDGGMAALPGVYASLDHLDNAHIRATIPIQTTLALDSTVPVQASTRIALTQDLLVRGAHVTINSAGLSIDAPADITLPAGTEMDVSMDLVLPLQTALPAISNVPVDIPIRDTELHMAIQGLKDSLRPLICASMPGATMPDGTLICR